MEGWNSGWVPSTSGGDVVVGPLYCAPHAVHLTFTKKAPGVKSGHLTIVDAYGRVMYKVEDHESWTLRDRRLLLDVYDQPIVLVQSKRKTSSAVYDVYRGDSRDARDLLFSIRKVSASEVHVFLAANTKEHFADYKVKGYIKDKSVAVYKGESTQMVAEMSEGQKFSSTPVDKKSFGAAVSPNVDSCFMAALFVALPEIYDSSDEEDAESITSSLGELISSVVGSQ